MHNQLNGIFYDTHRPTVHGKDSFSRPPAKFDAAISGFYDEVEAARHCPVASRRDLVYARNNQR